MTRTIVFASGKGGVGKTTMVANIGSVLAKSGKDVVVVDANLTTPNLGLHLGVPLFPMTLHDVLKGRARLSDAIYHHESGLRIIPAGISLNDLKGVDSAHLPNTLLELLGNTDIVLIDASAGLGRETLSALESGDELVIITNPDLPSVTDALKLAKLSQRIGAKPLGLIINRVQNKPHEMRTEDIVSMLDDIELLGEVPEDISVQEAIAARNPVTVHKPYSSASKNITKLAGKLIGEDIEIKEPFHRKLFKFIFK